MSNESSLGIFCDVCQLRIHEGHLYIPFVPAGYGQYKGMPNGTGGPGNMHVSHLTSSDILKYTPKLRA